MPPAFMGPKPASADIAGPDLAASNAMPPASFGATPQPAAPTSATAAPSSPSYADRFREIAGQEPNRADYPTQPMPWWRKALGTLASIAGGLGRHDSTTYDLERNLLNSPEAKAEKKYEQDKGLWQDRMNAVQKEAGLENTSSEIASRGNKDEAALAKIGMKRGPNGEIVPDESSEVYKTQEQRRAQAEQQTKSLQELRDSQETLNEARAEAEKAKNDPNSPAYKAAQQKLAMAQRAHDVAAANLGLHQQEFANKIQEQELVKPSGQATSRGSAAQAVLDIMPDLEKSVRANAAEMGPIMGRLNRGEIKIGDVSPDVARLYSAMKSFYALQPAVHGFRNAEFVKDFETALGTLERDPDAFIAGMQGLKPTLESVAKEGKTYHKRIVEAGGNNAPAAAAGGKAWNPKTGRYE